MLLFCTDRFSAGNIAGKTVEDKWSQRRNTRKTWAQVMVGHLAAQALHFHADADCLEPMAKYWPAVDHHFLYMVGILPRACLHCSLKDNNHQLEYTGVDMESEIAEDTIIRTPHVLTASSVYQLVQIG